MPALESILSDRHACSSPSCSSGHLQEDLPRSSSPVSFFAKDSAGPEQMAIFVSRNSRSASLRGLCIFYNMFLDAADFFLTSLFHSGESQMS
jgi:hypothetical protein